MLEGYKTYIGIAISVLGTAAGLFQWNVGDLTLLQTQLVSIVGAVLAIYGRYAVKAV